MLVAMVRLSECFSIFLWCGFRVGLTAMSFHHLRVREREGVLGVDGSGLPLRWVHERRLGHCHRLISLTGPSPRVKTVAAGSDCDCCWFRSFCCSRSVEMELNGALVSPFPSVDGGGVAIIFSGILSHEREKKKNFVVQAGVFLFAILSLLVLLWMVLTMAPRL
ncbi:MAG: hypothetical protein BYD32DRAFT_230292 [Podila humilis]|nr:MAG: hypothetical protein BYD32DRAFT_230292 [Podila humilis]